MDELFPLPIEAFEYYYLCDDRPEYPTTFPIELAFSGRLERDAFEAALQQILLRHPMLTARIDLNGGGRPNWVAADTPPSVAWLDENATREIAADQRIDIAQSPGLRLTVRQVDESAQVRLLFHHASCDGRGAFQFIEELLLAYHAAVRATPATLPPLEPLRLRDRANFGGPKLSWWATKREMWRTAAYWISLLLRAPTPLTTSKEVGASPQQVPYRTCVLDGDTIESLRAAAAAEQVTVNDLLLRDLLLVVARWNYDHGVRRGWLRINVPTSRREKRMPAATLLNFDFITQHARKCVDPQQLLESICRQTDRIKGGRRRPYYLYGLTFACGIRGLVPWVLSWNKCFATMVMSNVGTVFARTALPRRDGKLVCGEAVLDRVAGVPPIRPLTRAAIAVIAYAGETTINLNCDARCFNSEQADKLLEYYVAQVNKSAATGSIASESSQAVLS